MNEKTASQHQQQQKNTKYSSMTIFPSFNSFHNGGQSIATLIKEKRRQLSIANSPITSPTQLLELLLPPMNREKNTQLRRSGHDPTTEEWWAFGGIRHKTSRKFSIQSTRSSITSIHQLKNKTTELDEEDDEEERRREDEERLMTILITPVLAFTSRILCRFDTTEAEPTLLYPLSLLHGIFNTPRVHSAVAYIYQPPRSYLTAMHPSLSVTHRNRHRTLTRLPFCPHFLTRTTHISSRSTVFLMHDGIVRKTIDPRSYSAMTGHRNLDSFITHRLAQRILADCWKRHKVLGPVPVEIHVLDHLRRELKKSKGENLSIESIQIEVISSNYVERRHSLPQHNYATIWRSKDLFEHIEQSPDGLATQEVKKIFGQIVDGVAFLHDRNIVHRDLKDENVILDPNGNPQLIDFGSAAYVREGSKFVTFSGTLDFAAPEVLKGDPHGGKEIDIWALGVILFVLITGECPFWNPEEAAKGIGEGSRARTKLEEHTEKKQISHDHNED
ncbi:hypothetical protein H4Q26_008678 [Puccinia striiformis f. sp. tritici PST-130]|nr:hypothetical protein H4Q26_008678 [Puccinia striiformis f. sp. tritici PST-130]